MRHGRVDDMHVQGPRGQEHSSVPEPQDDERHRVYIKLRRGQVVMRALRRLPLQGHHRPHGAARYRKIVHDAEVQDIPDLHSSGMFAPGREERRRRAIELAKVEALHRACTSGASTVRAATATFRRTTPWCAATRGGGTWPRCSSPSQSAFATSSPPSVQ